MSPVFLAALFAATLMAELLAFEGGLRLGRWRSQRANPEPPLPARVLVTSTLNMLAISSGRRKGGSPTPAPLLQSLTDAIDVHGERALIGVRTRIPIVAWIVLVAIMFMSIASAGYLAGLAGARRSIAATGYALVFAAVIIMIVVAADVPGTEQLRTSHQALVDLRSRLTDPELRK